MYTPLTNNGFVKRIVIDAGHGGRDFGAVSPDGLAEKDVTLEVAQLLKHDIESRLGIEVLLTRDGDYYVPLPVRSQKANASGADLFISLHANAAEASSEDETGDSSIPAPTGGVDAHGVETYFLSRATSTAAEQIAARENAAGGVTGPVEQTSGAKVIESHILATYIQRCLVRGLRSVTQSAGRDRGVKQAPFFVLNNTQIPSVLVEISFITSRDDQQRLRTDAFRQKIADSLLEGVRSYILNVSQRKSTGEDQLVIR
jgi:N-acetylmuramoyl-L-alanine amidase